MATKSGCWSFDSPNEQMIYLYRCDECALSIEEDHRMGDAPRESECPICGETTQRIFSAPAVHYKGSGWATSGTTPDRNERANQPGAQEYDDLLED